MTKEPAFPLFVFARRRDIGSPLPGISSRILTIAKLAVILLAATALASSAVAEQRKGRATTCRGVLTDTSPVHQGGSGDTYRIGHCRIYFDAYAGVVEAIARTCKVGDRCTVRARAHDGAITYVYSVARR